MRKRKKLPEPTPEWDGLVRIGGDMFTPDQVRRAARRNVGFGSSRLKNRAEE